MSEGQDTRGSERPVGLRGVALSVGQTVALGLFTAVAGAAAATWVPGWLSEPPTLLVEAEVDEISYPEELDDVIERLSGLRADFYFSERSPLDLSEALGEFTDAELAKETRVDRLLLATERAASRSLSKLADEGKRVRAAAGKAATDLTKMKVQQAIRWDVELASTERSVKEIRVVFPQVVRGTIFGDGEPKPFREKELLLGNLGIREKARIEAWGGGHRADPGELVVRYEGGVAVVNADRDPPTRWSSILFALQLVVSLLLVIYFMVKQASRLAVNEMRGEDRKEDDSGVS